MPLILVVDDYSESRYMLEVLLQSNGFETIAAKDGREALEIARTRKPDLIISDILMPVMDGFTLCKELKSDDKLKTIPFIFLTATYTDPRDIEFGLNLGANKFLIKPQELDMLLKAIREVLSESAKEAPIAAELPLEQDMEFLRYHNEALFRKLQKKMADLEAANKELQETQNKLEEKIKERTAELQQSYDRLLDETRERQELETQLRHSQKMEALGTLSGGIAHDFNNILAAIIGFTEMVLDNLSEGGLNEQYLRQILEASFRARDLIRQLLTFSSKTQQRMEPLRLSTVLKDAIKLLRAVTPATIDIKIEVISEHGFVIGDKTQIQQMIMNLCNNSIYAMRHKGGVLKLELSDFAVTKPGEGGYNILEPGSYMKLVVRDTGTGIPPDVIDRVFDPFFTTKKHGQGTGLGLSVAMGIIKQMNGYIFAESTQGKSTTFTIFLPQKAGEIETRTKSTEEISKGSEHILFVDDEEMLAEAGRVTLSELGYQVTSDTSGKEALSLVKEDPNRFDLVITDQTMPDITGFELAQEILKVRSDMPIILCTGFSELVDADKAKTAGIRVFMMKPLSKAEMAKTIREVLDERTGHPHLSEEASSK